MNKLELIISSDLSKLSEVENFIDHIIIAFQIKEKLRGKITLSIIEAVTNAILFGNKQNSRKQVRVTVTKNIKTITFTVEDERSGFDYTEIPDPTIPQKYMQAAKKGLYLMLNLTDKLSFAKHGAKVSMTFLLDS